MGRIVDVSCLDVSWTPDCVRGGGASRYGSRGPQGGWIHHSDRGSQYASEDYQEALKQAGVRCSMSRKGDCWDNGVPRTQHETASPDREVVLRKRWRLALRSRATGSGFKPRRAAAIKSRGGERRRKRCPSRHQVGNGKTNASELLMTCRKAINRHQNRAALLARDESRRRLFVGWVVSGMEAA